MMVDPRELRDRASQLARHPRTRKIAIWFVAILVAIGIIAGLAAPPLVRNKLASTLSDKFHRPVTIEQLRINPYAVTATVRGFLMKERDGSATAVSFDELHINLELQSLFRLAPVIKELRLVKPYVNVVRNEDRTYNYQDLIDEFTSGPPKPAGPPPRFALNNIEIIDGEIDFDDRPEKTKHKISSIRLGVPFVSSLPSQADIKVQPGFSALINGAPLIISGETKPFKDSRESTIRLNIDKLQIPKYLEYSPVQLNFRVPTGEIEGKLTASFRTFANKSSSLSISGNLALQQLVMQEKDEKPLVTLPSLELDVDAFDVFARRAVLRFVKVQGLDLHLIRRRDGGFNLTSLVQASAPAEAPAPAKDPEPKKEPTPFTYNVNEILLESSTLHFADQTLERPYQTTLDNVRINVKNLTNEPDKKAELALSFESKAKERVNHVGTVQLTPLLVEGKVELAGLQPGAFEPYYRDATAAQIKDGYLDLSTRYTVARNGQATDVRFSDVNAALHKLRLELPGEREPLWRIPLLAIKDGTVDVGKKTIVLGALEAREGNGHIQRNSDGAISYSRLARAPAAGAAKAPVKDPPPAKKDDAEWTIEAKQINLDRFRVAFDDRGLQTPAKVALSDFSLRVDNFSNAKNRRAKASLRTRINNKGLLQLAGPVGVNPVAARLNVQAQQVELLPFQPYLAEQVNFILTSGNMGTKGNLSIEASAGAPAKVGYEGSFQVADFAAVEKDTAQDLLKWKSLDLGGVQLAAVSPLQLAINDINLADFYARIIIAADGKINLQNLAAEKKEPSETGAPPASTPASATDTTPAATTTPPAGERRISIGKINLQGGDVNFSDFFIKPNYSANLNAVQGTIAELKPETPGDIMLQAKLDNAAPVDIQGKINPLAKNLFLDLTADAKEIDLNPFSPYAVKYVGYGIERGKLSFNVKYKVEDRKLTAENQIILNQLVFGEKVESPTATKLPVLLAVALLKDRNGVIDVNLPVSGSLDDPKFSVGGIVLRLVINLITRAVTAPFALLGSVFGGGSGAELSYIEFEPGRTTLTQAAEAKIKTLAAAMNNRPALKLEISGRTDPAGDLEGLKRVGLERKVKAQKFKELARQGNPPKSVDDVQIEKPEYERYLKAAYGAESFPKPRNVIGLAKDLPVSEMEALMLKNATVSDADVRDLANQRAQVVRDRLLATGQITADRVSLVAPKAVATDDKEKAKAKLSRVDFSLR
jgi:uncharacterized protein involved in outer membrane biogenesis